MVGFIFLLVVLYCSNYLDYKYHRYSVNCHEMDTSQTYLAVFVVFLNMNFKVNHLFCCQLKSLPLVILFFITPPLCLNKIWSTFVFIFSLASLFQATSRCLDIGWNTLSRFWSITKNFDVLWSIKSRNDF